MDITRRTLLGGSAALSTIASAAAETSRPRSPADLARDENWWRRIAQLYDQPPPGVVQLESGQFGAMPTSVRKVYERHINRINRETTLYTRQGLNDDLASVRNRTAALLGVDRDEIAFTRGGSESMAALIGGYNRLKPGDAVIYADLDYDSMQAGMESLARLRGVHVIRIDLPEPATAQNIIDTYDRALRDHPEARMMLLTHLSHRTGLVPPVT